MSENAEVPDVPTPSLRWVKFLLGVAAVLSLAWLYFYVRELHWRLDPWLASKMDVLPGGVRKLVGAVAMYVIVPLPMFVFLVAAFRIGFWLDLRRLSSPRAMLEAVREGHRQGEAKWEEHVDNILRNATDLPPEELAQLRAELEETGRKVREGAARKEKLYAENPALMENDLRMAIESIQAKERAGGV